MIRRRAIISLLLAAAFSCGCGAGTGPSKPELPASVSPGWTLKSYAHSEAPAGIPLRVKPECWLADYVSTGSAKVWICGYAESSSAFDAMQRATSEADTVKFQEDRYLAVVKWTSVSRAEITALVRAIQKTLSNRA